MGFSGNVVQQAMERDGFTCQECKRTLEELAMPHQIERARETGKWGSIFDIHHKESRKGGDNSLENAMTVCLMCHHDLHKEMDKTPTLCPECGKEFQGQFGLNSHIAKAHKADKTPTLCPICGDEFMGQKSLNIHIALAHTQDRTLIPCPICRNEFKGQFGLNQHIGQVHKVGVIQ